MITFDILVGCNLFWMQNSRMLITVMGSPFGVFNMYFLLLLLLAAIFALICGAFPLLWEESFAFVFSDTLHPVCKIDSFFLVSSDAFFPNWALLIFSFTSCEICRYFLPPAFKLYPFGEKQLK